MSRKRGDVCRTVELSREAQRGAAHHLGYRTMNVFLRGCPGAQENKRKGVRSGSVDVGLPATTPAFLAVSMSHSTL